MKKKILLIFSLLFLLSSPVHAAGILDNFTMSDADLSGTTYYIGYQSTQGGWTIKALQQKVYESGVTSFFVSWCYISNATDYKWHWENRATLTGVSRYRKYDEAF